MKTQTRLEQEAELKQRISNMSDENVMRLLNAVIAELEGDGTALKRLAEEVEQEAAELEARHSGGAA